MRQMEIGEFMWVEIRDFCDDSNMCATKDHIYQYLYLSINIYRYCLLNSNNKVKDKHRNIET